MYQQTAISPAQFAEVTIKIDEARALMREFGKGLDEGRAPHDGAQQHDHYLYAHTRKYRQFGNANGMVKIADDFDEPLADFQEYIE